MKYPPLKPFIRPVLVLLSLFLLAVLGHGIPQNFNQEPDPAELRADQSVVIKPGQAIALGFEVQDGKMFKLTKLPWNTVQKENILRISLSREGGVATKLGPISPIKDSLDVICSPGKPLSARSESTAMNATRPQKSRLSAKDGNVHKSYQWGVSQVVISEFELKLP